MSEFITLDDLDIDISHLTTEDDQPVDNLSAFGKTAASADQTPL